MVYLIISGVIVFILIFYMSLFKAAAKEDEYLAKQYREVVDEE